MLVQERTKIVVNTIWGKILMDRWIHYLYTAVACLLACIVYYNFAINKAYVEFELEVTEKADFKIYWAEKGQVYSEKHMSVVVTRPGRIQYSFFLTNIRDISRLRVDTHNYAGEATLRSLSVEQAGYAPIKLSDSRSFRRLAPLAQIEDFRAADDGLWLRSTGEDPNFELLINPDFVGISPGWLLFRFAVVILFVIPVCLAVSYLARDYLFVPVFLSGVLVLIIVMAGISERNAHPDEYVHLQATSYYEDHWLPPLFGDDSVRDSYSVYGVSRLNNGEVYYLFSGKFHGLLESFKIPEYFSMRMFNICLFGLILLSTIKNHYARMVAIPFLLSPQIWYVFSYCSSDAFALFVTFLAGCQLVNPASCFSRFLKGGSQQFISGLLVMGFLLGCLFLLKMNYYPFIAFFYFCLGIQLFFNIVSREDRNFALRRLAAVTAVGILFCGLRLGADYMVNGFDLDSKFREAQEQFADPKYKPSTELHEKYGTLLRKDRGDTLRDLVTRDHWFEKSFQSGFGVFGYFTISASQIYYDMVRWTSVGLLVFVFGSIFIRGGLVNSTVAFSVLVVFGLLIAASLHRSWTWDFQSQGRYLFPIVPIFGILYARTYRVIYQPLLILGVSSMYFLGMYVFIFEALVRIPKVVFH